MNEEGRAPGDGCPYRPAPCEPLEGKSAERVMAPDWWMGDGAMIGAGRRLADLVLRGASGWSAREGDGPEGDGVS